MPFFTAKWERYSGDFDLRFEPIVMLEAAADDAGAGILISLLLLPPPPPNEVTVVVEVVTPVLLLSRVAEISEADTVPFLRSK